MSWVSDAWDAVTGVGSGFLASFFEAVKRAAEEVADAAEDFVEDLGDAWDAATEHGLTVVGVLAGLVGTLGALVDFVFDVVGAVVGGVVTVVCAIVGVVLGTLVSLVSPSAGRSLANWIYDKGAWLGDKVSLVFDSAGSVIEWTIGNGASVLISVNNWWACARGHATSGQPPQPA